MTKKTLLKLKNGLTKDLPWKVAAFLLAFALWFFIMNITDPIRNINVPVSLTLRNEAAFSEDLAHIHLENLSDLRNTIITIQVRGSENRVNELRSSFVAYIDLSTSDIIGTAGDAGTINVTVQVDGAFGDGIELLSRRPASVELRLDTMLTRYIDVDVETQGNVAYGFFSPHDSIVINPASLPVTGPASYVSRIESLVVSVDVSDFTAGLSLADQPVTAYDAAGQQVRSPHMEIAGTVDIVVPVYRRGILTVAAPIFQGQPQPGFGIYAIRHYPQVFEVAGTEESIANLTTIQLDPIPAGIIGTATEPFEHIYDLRPYLPDDVFLVAINRHTITVEVLVEPIVTQYFTIQRENFQIIGMPPNTTILTDEVTISISALRPIMEQMGSITANARMGQLNLPPGQHNIPLNFTGIPSRASIIGPPPTLAIYIAGPEDEIDVEENNNADAEEARDENDESND